MASGGGSVGTVFVDVIPNLSKFAATAEAQIGSATSGLTKSASAVGTTIGLALGAGAVAILAKAAQGFEQLGLQVFELQKVTGLSAEGASKLLFAMHAMGIDAAKTNVALGLLAKNIANNTSNFTKYGIATTNAQGEQMGLNKILGEAADKYVALGGGLKGTAFAMNVFGRSGKTLIPILALGAEGIKELEARAADMGVVLGQTDVDAARQFAISQRELQTALTGLSVSIGQQIVPALTSMVDGLTGAINVFTRIPGSLKVAVLGFVALTGALIAIVKIAKVVGNVWGPIVAAFKGAAIATYDFIAALTIEASAEGVAAAATTALAVATDALLVPLLAIGGPLVVLAGTLLLVTGNAKAVGPALTEALKPVAETAFAMALAQDTGISFAKALVIVKAQAAATAASMDALQSATKGFDPTKLLSESPKALASITDFALHGTSALKEFGQVSGTSVDSIQNSLASLVTDAKATSGDYISVIDSMKSAWSDWHDTIVTALGGSASALTQFLGKSNVSFSKAMKSLADYRQSLKSFQADIVSLRNDPAAKGFLGFVAQNGLQAAGILDAVASKGPKAQNAFFKAFDAGNKGTETLASVIQNTLLPKFNTMIETLKTIANQLGANFKLKVDTSQAQTALKNILDTISALPRQKVIDIKINQIGSGKVLGLAEHGAFIPAMATGGFVKQDQVIRVGEHHKSEMVLPLQDKSGIDALTKALEKAGAGGGSGRMHIIEGRIDVNTGAVRIIAREESDDDHSFHRTLARMAP